MSVKKVWIGCMACMIGCFSVSAQQRIEPADLPILAWYGIPAHEATVERFEELRDAGFTLNFRSFPSADAVAKGLDAAGKAGIKLIIGCPELEKEPEKTVRRFMNHSALAGYFLRDEPRSNEFAELGEWARRIQAVDNEHFCYLNLFPTGPKEHLDQLGVKSYREYVSRFDEQVKLMKMRCIGFGADLSGFFNALGTSRKKERGYQSLSPLSLPAGRSVSRAPAF